MASEFGDVLIKHRESGQATLIMGNGDPVFAVRLVESYLIVGSSYGFITVFALQADGTLQLTGHERMVDTAILQASISPPMRVWMATGAPILQGVELTDLAPKTFLLPSTKLPPIDMVEMLSRRKLVSPNGHGISYAAPHPTLENVFAICRCVSAGSSM